MICCNRASIWCGLTFNDSDTCMIQKSSIFTQSQLLILLHGQVTKESLDKAISICGPGVEFKKIGRTIK